MPKTDMPDLPMKSGVRPPAPAWDDRKAAAEAKVKAVQRQTAKKRSAPTKQEQPRDKLGRFARKTGQVLMGAAKGTAKAVKSVHKTVKRVRADSRRHASLEHRERKIALVERERKAGLKRKKVVRRRVR